MASWMKKLQAIPGTKESTQKTKRAGCPVFNRDDCPLLPFVTSVYTDVTNGSNGQSSLLKTGQPARFVFCVDSFVPGIACNFFIHDAIGQPITSFYSRVRGPDDAYDPEHGLKFVCDLDELLLLPGRYRIDVAIVGDNKLQDFIEGAGVFEVGDGQVGGRTAQHDGKVSVTMKHRWTFPWNS